MALTAGRGEPRTVDRVLFSLPTGTDPYGHLSYPDPSSNLLPIEALDDECRRLRQAQTLGRVGSWEQDLSTGELVFSKGFLDLFGLGQRATSSSAAEMVETCVHVEDREEFSAAYQRLVDGGEPMSARFRMIRFSKGAEQWVYARAFSITEDSNHARRVVGIVADVSELVQAEVDAQSAHSELDQANSFYQAVITASPDAIHIYDVASRGLSRANLLAPKFIGYTDETIDVMSGTDLERLVPADDLRNLEQAFVDAQTRPDGHIVQLRHRVVHQNGTMRWLSRRLTPFRQGDDGQVIEILVVTRDVTDSVQVEERLAYAALHDELTGLPNRRLVRDHLTASIQAARSRGRTVAMICDLDNFKRINDSHGHRTGDSLLVATAARLTQAIRPGDLVARMGGDEFVVVLDVPENQDPQRSAETVARRIERIICEPVAIGATEHMVTVSIGICIATNRSTADSILSDADTAMYHVKAHGANGHTTFEPGLRRDTAGQDHTERLIRRALADNTVEVYYQPVINPVTNTVHSVEALLRISDLDGTHVDTGRVIAVAEQTGLISPLDERVLEIACQQVTAWRKTAGLRHLGLALNRSVRDIAKPGFYERIHRVVASSGLDPSALTLEITETVLLDADRATLTDLRNLYQQGIGIAIDDFGTGYASLSYLTALPITCIKIDRSFTSGLPEDKTCTTLVRATVGIAEGLAINCIVEGVETAAQLSALPSYERLLVQGYLYSRPKPATALPQSSM